MVVPEGLFHSTAPYTTSSGRFRRRRWKHIVADGGRPRRRLQWLPPLVVGTILMIGGGWIIGGGLVWLAPALGFGKGIGIAAAVIVTPLVLISAWFATFPRFTRRALRKVLRECGYNVCIRCGHLLDGLEAPARCPECGRTKQTPSGVAAADAPAEA